MPVNLFWWDPVFSGGTIGKMKKIVVAIDGWSSCGKSTLAKQMAKELGYIYVDSGAMYRAITLYFLRNHVDWNEKKAVKKALKDIELDFRLNEQNENVEIYLNDENVEYLVRDLIVAEKVSEVAAIRSVREFAVAQQQKLGKKKGIVMDGRDIGTVVFPKAELKIFMTADNAVRVERRFRELVEKNPNITIEEVAENIQMRDYIDSNREVSPLRRAEDAVVIDNTKLTQEEQLKKALKLAKNITG
ncbi:cytidylate kinase [Niabella drilacis]|uniref:Cytidylate kinase n=2 Tax=Niabella drilacis (strain DSM 25811 / CCM 8410 / CCUG 62505 / LMG 26954 / E90) TaxID=1285928 RepID=A0A1G6LKF1_NIADE|nr:cytidylate kinase [Niabella drilacis]